MCLNQETIDYVFDLYRKILDFDMIEVKKNKDVVKATKEGRIYIENEDFFKQEKVQSLISRLKKSSIFKEIESKKKELNPEIT
ncbi:hypothetical protein [Cyclobacterium amurskyense]|nr:hypothetical protein [Cyclobacterium amurskyense]